MLVIRGKAEMLHWAEARRKSGKRLGFVPTMGALHSGHLSLIATAADECDEVVVSIFVNRRQFNNEKDFDKYPRTAGKDLQMAASAGAKVVFMPQEDDLFSLPAMQALPLDGLDTKWEGAFRPGHFKGVAEVVWQLFNAVRPHKVFFGEKDYQQVLVIQKLIARDFPEIDLLVMPTIREADGLAMSSRNVRLSGEQRAASSEIYRQLSIASKKLLNGEGWQSIKAHAIPELKQKDLETEYLAWVNSQTLDELGDDAERAGSRIIYAGYIGGVRLIDNLEVKN